MGAPKEPYTPYAEQHKNITGPDDGRPSAIQVAKDCNANLKGKTVLITGCSSGIGVETARALYETGATLFLQARDMAKLEKVIDDIVSNAKINQDGSRPQGVEIHLDSLDSVRKGAEDFLSKSGTLNILICNAGVMASPFGTTKDGLETQIGVNHFAHFLLFSLLKDTLIASAKSSGSKSRVIDVSSYGHVFGPPKILSQDALNSWNKGEGYEKWASYGQAKSANIWMANEISRRYSSQGVEGLSLHPGGIMTELGRHIDPKEIEELGGEAMMKTFKSPSQGAATTVWAAVSPHFDKPENCGRYLSDVGEGVAMTKDAEMGAPVYAEHAYNPEGEKALWKVSCEVTGVKDD